MKKIGNSSYVGQPLAEYLFLDCLPINIYITASGLSLGVVEHCENFLKQDTIKFILPLYYQDIHNKYIRNIWQPFIIETYDGHLIIASQKELKALEGIAEEWYNEQNYYHA